MIIVLVAVAIVIIIVITHLVVKVRKMRSSSLYGEVRNPGSSDMSSEEGIELIKESQSREA